MIDSVLWSIFVSGQSGLLLLSLIVDAKRRTFYGGCVIYSVAFLLCYAQDDIVSSGKGFITVFVLWSEQRAYKTSRRIDPVRLWLWVTECETVSEAQKRILLTAGSTVLHHPAEIMYLAKGYNFKYSWLSINELSLITFYVLTGNFYNTVAL